ncbi:MAG: membrane protein insertion efficiency factor YidD [Rhodospirillales bacterium]|nr:membrane protein insertion efficiency factor YidD [Rhodospirillales bacterium]
MMVARKLIWGLIRAYQLLISPVFPMSCRYSPSCSAYAAEAVMRHGALRGSWLAVRRMVRCHPWGGWGYDPVPGTDDGLSRKPVQHEQKGCSHAG